MDVQVSATQQAQEALSAPSPPGGIAGLPGLLRGGLLSLSRLPDTTGFALM